ASYLLSRTLVPTMVRYLLASEVERYHGEEGTIQTSGGIFGAIHHGFLVVFERFRNGYRNLLASALAHRGLVVGGFLLICAACFALAPFLGEDFFPQVDAGQIRLHVRAPAGTRGKRHSEHTRFVWDGRLDQGRQVRSSLRPLRH